MSSTLNEIATFLSKPIPLGLMLVFFFVSLAVFSLFLGRVETRNRQVQLRYQEQIYALTQQGGQSWAGVYEPLHYKRSGGGWLGWITVLALIIGGGVVLHTSQNTRSSELVVPKLAGIGAKGAEFQTVKPAPALAKAPVAEPKPIVIPTPVPPAAPETVVVQAPAPAEVPRSRPKAPMQKMPGAKPGVQGQGADSDLERMLARERRRAARRRQARRGGGGDGWEPERPRNRRAANHGQQQRRAASQPKAAAPSEPSPAKKQVERKDELLPESSLPKKRRRRLKLDRSNDPLGSL